MSTEIERKKKIAVVTPYGAEARFDNYAEYILAQTLRERGWDARMFTYAVRDNPAHRSDRIYNGLPVRRCRERFGISPWLFFSILFFRPQTVICFHPKNFLNFTAFIAARLVGARVIVEIVGILHDPYIVKDVDDPENNLRSPLRLVTGVGLLLKELAALRISGLWTNYIRHMPPAHADALIAISEHEKKYVETIYHRTVTRIYWSAPRYIDHIQKKPDAAIPTHFHLFIGQIKLRKGWDTVIDALAHLKKLGSTPHLVFVTPHKDLREPTEYARERGVLPQITFLSEIPNEERNWLYAHCTYVLNPSRYEGFGLIAFEAFLARKPMCATTIVVFLEFLKDRKNAMLVPPGNGEALAGAIQELDANQELRERLVQGGLETAKEFSYERMVNEHIALIEKVFLGETHATPLVD